MKAVAGVVACALAGCGFVADVPDAALILCARDDECPAGLRCTETHECKPPSADVQRPDVVRVELTPAHAKDGDIVELRLEIDEAVDGAPTLVFDGVDDPGFAFDDASAPASPRWTLGVDASVAEGTYALVEVALVDAAGNAAVRPAAASLVVDRTPPVVANLRVAAPAGAMSTTLADVAGFDAVVIDADVSEPLGDDGPTATLGALTTDDGSLACAARPASALGWRCTGMIVPGSVVDGANTATFAAVDRAGNVGSATTTAAVDAAAPTIVQGSVDVDPFTPSGQPATVLVEGGGVRVRFVVSEELAADPVVAIDAGPLFTGALVDRANRFYEYAIAIDQPLSAPSVSVTFGATDIVGHVATSVTIPLPAPYEDGIPVGAFAPSRCPLAGDPTRCPDVDGDGAPGFVQGCAAPMATDCNDDEPRAFPGAPEIPGDGIDNDCLGDGDLPIDDATGVFVNAAGGGANPGTRASPMPDVRAAIELAQLDGRAVFVQGDVDPECTSPDEVDARGVTIVGGLTDAWEPGAVDRSTSSCPIRTDRGVWAIAAPHLFPSEGALLVDAAATNSLDGGGTAVGTYAAIAYASAAVPLRLVDSSATDLSVYGTLVIERGEYLRINSMGVATFHNTLIHDQLTMYDGRVLIVGSTLYSIDGDPVYGAAGEITLVNSVIVGATNATAGLSLDAASYTVVATLFDVPGDLVTGIATANDLNACTAAECRSASGNVAGTFLVDFSDHVHITNGDESLAANIGVDPLVYGAPPSVAADRDGDCRSLPSDVGADELP